MNSSFLREEREDGFSLVELLVVIVIIGILSSIAIAAFLNQRKKANDAAVESDMRNAINEIETAFIDYPNATGVYITLGELSEKHGGDSFLRQVVNAQKFLTLTEDYSESPAGISDLYNQEINFSEDVHILALVDPNVDGYVLYGTHWNGSKYSLSHDLSSPQDSSFLVYDSSTGKFGEMSATELEEKYSD